MNGNKITAAMFFFAVFSLLWHATLSARPIPEGDIENYSGRGSDYLLKGEFDKAIAEFNQAITLIRSDPKPQAKYAPTFYNRGAAYAFKGNMQQALSDFEEAVKVDPNYILAYYRRADLYQKMGRLDEALADYNAIVKLNPDQTHAYNNRGLIYNLKGEYDLAINEFDKALKINPKFINAYYNRGLANLDKKDFFQAKVDLNRELELSPNSFNANHFYLAVSYFCDKQYDQSWDEVDALQAGGFTISPVFLEELKKIPRSKKKTAPADPIKKSGWGEQDDTW